MTFKKVLASVLCILLTVVFLPNVTVTETAAATTGTVYVSNTGSDSNDGSFNAPYLTLAKAFKSAAATDLTIILKDNISIESGFVFNNNNNTTTHTTITAVSSNVTLDLTAKTAIGFYDNVTFTGLTLDFTKDTIFCGGGMNVTITDSVTFTNRIKAFGGGYGVAVASTNLTLNGGIYQSIYAGGYNAKVTGNAVLTVGGNVNAGDGINDKDSSTISPCLIYGGCYSSTVGGSTTINFGGNAVTKYITGSGNLATDTITGDITINITGGKVMNVYGGSRTAAVNTNTYIYMTGGLAEALFGGCEGTGMTGNALIYVGGTADVSRRIYGGCYNDWSFSWSGSNHVTGSTTVIIDNGCNIASKTGLASGNQSNMGLFAGSRCSANQSDEVSTLIFLNNSYSSYSGKIGDVSNWGSIFKSHTDYTVKASAGGSITNSATAGTLTLLPDENKVAVIGSAYYDSGDTYALSATTTDVSFVDAYTVTYDYNNGSGLTSSDAKISGVSLTLADCTAEMSGYEFIGWSTSADATTAEYAAGSEYTADSDVTLYAVWQGMLVQYTVKHYIRSHINPEMVLYKTEKLEGRVGELTDATVMQILGYTAGTVTQKTLTANGATININYEKGSFASSDVNCDGTVDMMDSVILQRYLAGWSGYDTTNVCLYGADSNVDGSINATDALTLLHILAGNSPAIGKPDTEGDWGEWI